MAFEKRERHEEVRPKAARDTWNFRSHGRDNTKVIHAKPAKIRAMFYDVRRSMHWINMQKKARLHVLRRKAKQFMKNLVSRNQ